MSQHPSDNSAKGTNPSDPAVNLIRDRINMLYDYEPTAKAEIAELKDTKEPLSKHQAYMSRLSNSGKSLAEIQTAWHNYYQGLPDKEKHQVWQEFYAHNQKARQAKAAETPQPEKTENEKKAHVYHEPTEAKTTKPSVAELKKQLTSNARKKQKAKLSAQQHFKSLLFGVSMGAVVVLVLLFGFFNERFIAPFITPSKSISSTSIIIDPNSSQAGPETTVTIPKINVEVPVVYDLNSVQEKDIQGALERGVVHYASTASPGEQGNSVIVGHSSNNILNGGKYKFAFVLLNKLENGDTFMLTKNGKRYVYRVYEKKIVKPTDISVLGATDKPATATLITCDPPGTSINRLIIVGEQISPDPAGNSASTAVASNDVSPSIVPGNAPTLWSRLMSWLTT